MSFLALALSVLDTSGLQYTVSPIDSFEPEDEINAVFCGGCGTLLHEGDDIEGKACMSCLSIYNPCFKNDQG